MGLGMRAKAGPLRLDLCVTPGVDAAFTVCAATSSAELEDHAYDATQSEKGLLPIQTGDVFGLANARLTFIDRRIQHRRTSVNMPTDGTGCVIGQEAKERHANPMVSRTLSESFSPRYLRPETVTSEDVHIDVSGPDLGPPVVLLHGWGSHAQNMAPVARALDATYRVHNVDLPGHGSSPPPPEPWGVPEFAGLVDTYIKEEIGRPATLFGHSNGGRIALYMASTPSMDAAVSRLVLVSPSGVAPDRSWSTQAKAGLARVLKAPIQILPPPLRDPAEDWLRHTILWRALGSSDYNAASGIMRETFVRTVTHHLDDQLARIDVPTLLFWGTEDPAISARQVQRIQSALADCGVVELPGAGHYSYLDEPATVMSATRHFLEATDSGSPGDAASSDTAQAGSQEPMDRSSASRSSSGA